MIPQYVTPCRCHHVPVTAISRYAFHKRLLEAHRVLAWAAKERVLFSSGTEDSTISAWAILPSNELELLMKLDAHKDTVQVRGP